MIPEIYETLEAAAFAALPALEPEEMVMGWRLRFSNGYTKRANSANCSLTATDLSAEQIEDIEQRYRQRALPPIFRLTSVATPVNMDNTLAQRGYSLVDPSWVMVLPALSASVDDKPVTTMDINAWAAAVFEISGSNLAEQATHLQMLRLIKEQRAFAVDYLDHVPVCAGLGVIHLKWIGLFDIATAATQRQKGFATALCRNLLSWGKQAGAESAYLQVTASNFGAIRVYEKLGFQKAYHYWYRVAA